MKTDSEIQKDVLNELKWNAIVSTTDLGVTVKGGITTLTGTVDTYSKKQVAEKAAMRVTGVKAVINDVEVKTTGIYKKTDAEITETVMNVIKWHSLVPQNKVKVKVEEGWVTLEGEVEWEYQKSSVETMIEGLMGVRGITNLIKVVNKNPIPKEIKDKIKASILRNITTDPERIKVEVTGTKVILTGEVRSLTEKIGTETTAWHAPGVTQVENKLEVKYSNVLV